MLQCLNWPWLIGNLTDDQVIATFGYHTGAKSRMNAYFDDLFFINPTINICEYVIENQKP